MNWPYLNELIGTPYTEMDCYTLVSKVSEELFACKLPTVADYATDAWPVVVDELRTGQWQRMPRYEQGLIALLGTYGGKSEHVGICIGDNLVLHTCYKFGAIIQDRDQLQRSGYTKVDYYRWGGKDG